MVQKGSKMIMLLQSVVKNGVFGQKSPKTLFSKHFGTENFGVSAPPPWGPHNLSGPNLAGWFIEYPEIGGSIENLEWNYPSYIPFWQSNF